jgi:N-acetyl-gamma-glutamyl-phosphate reductase
MAGQPIPVAVLGASGFSGAELLRLLAGHPSFQPVFLGAHDAAGQLVGDLYPHLYPYAGRTYESIEAVDPSALKAAFVALPAGESAKVVPDLIEAGLRVVDLGGDFRLPAGDYPGWYGFEHPAPAWLAKSVYGLTELFRDQVAGAALVANPGCYPTPVVLGLAPLFRAGSITGPIVVDGKSGISGAGRKLSWQSHFASLDGSVQAYRVGRHQHTPEMEMALATSTGADLHEAPTVTFVPHLVPTVRGIVTTSYVKLAEDWTSESLREALSAAYADEPFIRVLPAAQTPDPKRLTGTNLCELAVEVDRHSATAVVIGAIDNLGKGAAGQALQNLNVMFGLDETAGLAMVGVYP